jgi:hypothetical protein
VSLQDAPQMAHVKMTFFFPALLSSRLPQSLQKMSEPMADMMMAGMRRRRAETETN